MSTRPFLLEVQRRFASRPAELQSAYFFDSAGMDSRYDSLCKEAGSRVGFLAAVKAFPHAGVLSSCARAGFGFDVSNVVELDLVEPFIAAGMRVQLCGPAWGANDVISLVTSCRDKKAHAVCVAESDLQVAILARHGAHWGKHASAGLRVNLGTIEASLASRFGFDGDAVAPHLATLRDAGWTTLGLQAHDGLRTHCSDTYLEVARVLTSRSLHGHQKLSWFSLGGGLHFLRDTERVEVFEATRKIIDERVGSETVLTFEPGTYLSSGLGAVASQIVGTRTSARGFQLLLAVSSEAHLKWSKPNLVIPKPRAPHPAERPEQPDCEPPLLVSLLGSTCFEADRIGTFALSGGRRALDALLKDGFCILSGVNGYSFAWQVGFNGTGSFPCEFL